MLLKGRKEAPDRKIINPKESAKNTKKAGIYNNREVMLVTYFFSFLFLVMLGYLGYFVATNEQEMVNNSYNSRQEIILSQNYRGSIYSADGQVLSETRFDKDGTETRVYPFGNLFSHVVGYSTQGRTGVEAAANYYLINSNLPLTEKISNDIEGNKNPGDNVYTTLDVSLQQIAQKAFGAYDGAIIVTEPSTGKILAMASKPDYDPNQITAIWEDLVADEKSTVLLNRATQGLYPPGSTFKIITALEYIRQNPGTWQNYSYTCKGSFQLENHKISCYHGTRHGEVDFIKSFAKSCNSSFANIGMSLDHTKFAGTLKGLLFNSELPVRFSYSKSSIQIDNDTDMREMIQTSIGQGKTQITPLHLNMLTCAIANKGILMKPYVIDHVSTVTDIPVKTFHPSSYGKLLTEEEAAVLTEMMEAVVETGTGTKLSGLSYTAAGKTGSAEYNSQGDSHAWFTGFAPVENPQVCVTIIIEGAGSGGDYAVPIAKRIFDAYFD